MSTELKKRTKEYAMVYCLQSIEYYNKLAEKEINHPARREMFIQWSQEKQKDLISIQELEF